MYAHHPSSVSYDTLTPLPNPSQRYFNPHVHVKWNTHTHGRIYRPHISHTLLIVLQPIQRDLPSEAIPSHISYMPYHLKLQPLRKTIKRMPTPSMVLKLSTLCTRPATLPSLVRNPRFGVSCAVTGRPINPLCLSAFSATTMVNVVNHTRGAKASLHYYQIPLNLNRFQKKTLSACLSPSLLT